MEKLYPLVMADIALFTVQDRQLQVLLVKRKEEPAAGKWALPGGFLLPKIDADLDATARRVLLRKTQVDVPHLEQVTTVSGASRDPRGWSVCSLYYALLPHDRIGAVRGEKTEAVAWCNASKPQFPCAFDHAILLEMAVEKLRDKVRQHALPLHLLPAEFTLTQLQQTCEAIQGHALDKSVFRRRIKDDPSLVTIDGLFVRGSQRPAQLYQAVKSFRF